jgi:GTP-binding protein YchF
MGDKMKIGIIGCPVSGKTTVFEALTRSLSNMAGKTEHRIGTLQVPDSRVDVLSRMYNPRKTIYAQIEYLLPGKSLAKKDTGKEQTAWSQVRDCDAIILVVRNVMGMGGEAPQQLSDFQTINQELILSDLIVVEKRLERLETDKKRGKKIDMEELSLITQCLKQLENEIPLRKISELASAPALRGFAFMSAKPIMVLFNNADDDDTMPDIPAVTSAEHCMVIKAKLEQELIRMTEEEAREFLIEFNITASATDRVIQMSYSLLGLMSFFTVGEDEVRAWTIYRGTSALDAAEVIHSDIKKGFIRAEIISYNDLMDAGTQAEARKRGTFRLEGKTYEVQDGDIINFRFNV